MFLLDFINSIKRVIRKVDVIEDLRITIDIISAVLLPEYKTAADYFATVKFKSDINKQIVKDFNNKVDGYTGSKQPSIVGDICKRLSNVKDNAEYIQSMLGTLLEPNSVSEGLAVKKAALLRASGHISFLVSYAGDLLDYIYFHESLANNKAPGSDEDMSLTPIFIKNINNDMYRFFALISIYGVPNKDFVKRIDRMPEVVVSNKSFSSISSLFKPDDLDPFQNPYLKGFSGNPIFHLGKFIAEYQATRYKESGEKKRMLQLRLLHLKMQYEGGQSPQLEKEIIYTQNRIDKLSIELKDIEESAGM